MILSSRLWFGVAGICCVNLVWLALTRVELEWGRLWSELAPLGALSVAFLLIAQAQRRWDFPAWTAQRLVPLLWALVFLTVGWINMRVLNHLVMTTALPMQDHLLARGDAAIGFDWIAIFHFVHDHAGLASLLDTLYFSLTPLSVAAVTVLILTGKLDRAALFLESFFIAALVCVLIGAFFPATGTFVHYGLHLADFPHFHAAPGTFFVDALAAVRAPQGPIVLDPHHLVGLAAFPSLHTAAAVVLALSFWPMRFGSLVAIYAAGIVAATPVFGGHYGVDLLAGAVVALLAFSLAARLQTRATPVIA